MRETIDIGKSPDGIFIGFPESMYDTAKKPISGSKVHILKGLSEDDALWICEALLKEVKGESDND